MHLTLQIMFFVNAAMNAIVCTLSYKQYQLFRTLPPEIFKKGKKNALFWMIANGLSFIVSMYGLVNPFGNL